jgi:hypothetical protein
MNDYTPSNTSAHQQNEYIKLALWLQQVLAAPAEEGTEALASSDYHPRFYFQLPDFIMALLQNDQRAAIRYAPLLYHLAGCPTCRSAYLELFGAMRHAVATGDTQPIVNAGTRSLATIPTGTLVGLCQLLVSQAEAVLQQSRQDAIDGSAAARSSLLLAMRISASINQSSMRSRALQGLVRVATLFDGPDTPGEQEPAAHTYTPLMGAFSGSRRGTVVRRADMPVRSGARPGEQPAIYLQAHTLEGSITQQEDMLELRLHDLAEKLRGRYLSISVPLGSLIEPIRWFGGNPRAIRSIAPVDEDGSVSTPLGQTDLRLARADERSLLEVMFQLLEIRPIE